MVFDVVPNCKNNNPVLFSLYDSGHSISENRVVYDGCIDMGGLPDSFFKIKVTDDKGREFVEVPEGSHLGERQFAVNYRYGWLYINPNIYNGKAINLEFQSRGIELTPASRIYTFDANGKVDIVNTLQKYIDQVNDGIDFEKDDSASGIPDNIEPGDPYNVIFSKLYKWFIYFRNTDNKLDSKKADKQNFHGGFEGGSMGSTNSGGAIGYEVSSNDGGAVGNGATTQDGGAVGNGTQSARGFAGGDSAIAKDGGSIGLNAHTSGGGAVGESANSTDGGAIGEFSYTQSGGAIGNYANSTSGGAVGWGAVAYDGGAVGEDTCTSDGFAGGKDAQTKTDDGNYIDAIQLGTGTNSTPKTMQVYDKRIVEADGSLSDVGTISKLVYPVGEVKPTTIVGAINREVVVRENLKNRMGDLNILKNHGLSYDDLVGAIVDVYREPQISYDLATETLTFGG